LLQTHFLKKAFLIIGVCGLLLGSLLLYLLFWPNTGEIRDKSFLYIKTGSDYAALLKQVEEQHVVSDMHSFDRMAHWVGLPTNVHAGKYQIRAGMGNFTMVWLLKGGKQVPVKLVINKFRTPEDLMRKLSESLEPDSAQFAAVIRDTSFLHQYEIDSNQIQAIILPDTYHFYWNTDARKALEKIAKNYQKFWTADRKQKAAARHLSPAQIVTLSSIVEEETNLAGDKGPIASTYFNRLQKGMPLQADPTIKYALRDFGLKRILKGHMEIASPYNTYRNKGLPPGPICTPSMSTLDAVLDAPETDYLYFCARENLDGSSVFAATYDTHMQNARKYQAALNARGIH
jgi:UPF0755 protein